MSTKYTGNQIKHLGKAGIRSALKNRGLRSKLPDSYLPPRLLARRHANAKAAAAQAKAHDAKARARAAANAEVVPGSGLTKHAYDRAIDAATKIKYGPQERELGRQLGVNAAQQTRDAGWYDQYRQQIQGAEQQQAVRNQALSGQIAQLSQAGLEASGGAKLQQGQLMHDEAASRGVAVDPGLQPLSDHAALIRSALTNNFGVTTALQNGAALNNLGGVEAGAGLAKLEHLGGLSGAATQILKDQQGLAADKGNYKVQYGQDLKDQANKHVLEIQTFGSAQEKARLARAKAAADERHRQHSETAGDKKDAAARKKDAWQRRHHTGPYAKAAKPGTGAFASEAAKHGYTTKAWNALGTAGRRTVIGADKKTAAKGKAAAKGDEVTPAGTKVRTPAQHDGFSSGMDKWKGYVAKNKGKGRHALAGAIMGDPKGPGELATSVLLDVAFDHHVSVRNRQRLWSKGFSLKQLGLPGPTKARKKTGAQAYNGPH